MNFINENLFDYCVNHTTDESEILKELYRQTYITKLNPRMICGKHQGRLLSFISKIIKPKKILEIGTFTGLSSLSMSLALPKDGKLIALDKDKKTTEVAENFFKKAKQENKIKTIIKPALDSLKDLIKNKNKFDLVFIDADKKNYKNYYNQSLHLINTNGLIIIDNVLWYGNVVNKKSNDKNTLSIREFNSYINKDKRTENLIIPIGDGFTICRKL